MFAGRLVAHSARAPALTRIACGRSARAVASAWQQRAFSSIPLASQQDDNDAPPLDARSALGSTAAATVLLKSLPGSSTVFAASTAAPVPLVGPAMVSFLQTFPPIAAQVCFLAPWQAMKAVQRKGDVGDMPLLPYAAMSVNGIGWITYGVLAGEPTIWVPNITAFLFGSYYWYVYAQNTTQSMVPWVGGAAGAIGLIGYLGTTDSMVAGFEPKFALGVLLNAVVVAMFGGPLQAIKGVIDSKDTSSIPFPFAFATFANCLTWSAYGLLVINDPMVYVCNLLGLGSAIAQLGCHAKYGISMGTKEDVTEETQAKEEEHTSGDGDKGKP